MKVSLYGVAILSLCNIFSYIDRNIFNSLAPVIMRDLDLSHFQTGMLASAFFLVYMIASPFIGFLGDRGKRPQLLALSVFLWSLATCLAGFARNFYSMLFARSAVGIGESAYASVGPSLIEDLVPSSWKSRSLAIFLLAIPVGSALGYLIGGFLDDWCGWRKAFFIISGPGILLAFLSYFIKEPNTLKEHKDNFFIHLKDNIKSFFKNKIYILAVLGYTTYTFVIGGMSVWMPEILVSTKNLSLKIGNLYFGATLVLSGIIGTFLGAYFSDKLGRKDKRAPIYVCTFSILPSIPLAAAILHIENHICLFTALFLCEVLLFMSTGPINVVILESVNKTQRSVAMGFSVLVIHALGDLISPSLIGYLADLTDIITASTLLPAGLIAAFIFWLLCYRTHTYS